VQKNAADGYQNTALISSATSDPDNNSSTISFIVNLLTADLSIQKTADRTIAQLGEMLAWTIAVQNLGANDTTNAVVADANTL